MSKAIVAALFLAMTASVAVPSKETVILGPGGDRTVVRTEGAVTRVERNGRIVRVVREDRHAEAVARELARGGRIGRERPVAQAARAAAGRLLSDRAGGPADRWQPRSTGPAYAEVDRPAGH